MSGKFIRKIFFELLIFERGYLLYYAYPNLKLKMCIKNIVVEGTVSQIFDRDPGSFFIKFGKKYSIKKRKSFLT